MLTQEEKQANKILPKFVMAQIIYFSKLYLNSLW